MDIKCGSEIIDQCVGVTIPYTDAGFQLFVGEAISVFTGGLNIAFQMFSSSLSENMVKGLNAIRCAIVSGGNTVWYFIASAWWALYFVGQEALLEGLLDEGYPYICTCLNDVNNLAGYFGGNEETEAAFSFCSEAAESISM
jgi:hypothetical protein